MFEQDGEHMPRQGTGRDPRFRAEDSDTRTVGETTVAMTHSISLLAIKHRDAVLFLFFAFDAYLRFKESNHIIVADYSVNKGWMFIFLDAHLHARMARLFVYCNINSYL